MKIAFIIYDGLTTLDFIGVYDPVSRLKTMGFMNELEYCVCAFKPGIRSFEGLNITPDLVKPLLSAYDWVVIPGGNGIMALLSDGAFLEWIKEAGNGERTNIAAVCGGVLILGMAGMLKGKKATTHLNHQEILKKFTGQVSQDRIVDDGNVITARGVTSAIDLGLYICEKIAGSDVREQIQRQMDYVNYTTK